MTDFSTYTITDYDKQVIDKWLMEDVYPQIIAYQKKKIKKRDSYWATYQSCWEEGFPYGGAIGGGVSYIFTPNSIGMTFKVKVEYGKQVFTLDLTDYDMW